MILPSILLWRRKRLDRISRKRASTRSQFAKTELKAHEPQKPDFRTQELSKDIAHELRGGNNQNPIWELPGDMAHELRGDRDGDGDWELPGDMAFRAEGRYGQREGV